MGENQNEIGNHSSFAANERNSAAISHYSEKSETARQLATLFARRTVLFISIWINKSISERIGVAIEEENPLFPELVDNYQTK